MSVSSVTNDNTKNDNKKNKLFVTTTDVMNHMNSVLAKMEEPDEPLKPRFELQKRLPNGNTIRADDKDLAVADMESKVKQVATELDGLTPAKKLEWAQLQRAEGNLLYTQQEYKEAIDVYLTCLVAKTDCPDFTRQVYLPVMNNLAQCTLQLCQYRKAITFCTMALEDEATIQHNDKCNGHHDDDDDTCDDDQKIQLIAKLYFRRGKARRLSGEYVLARHDLIQAQSRLLPLNQHEAEHRAIEKELQLVQRSLTEAKKNESKQKDAMKRFFDTTTNSDVSTSPSRIQPPISSQIHTLYDRPKRKYSRLRARKEVEEEPVKHLTYVQYYLAVIGSLAERLLILLGDEETIQKEQELLWKED